MMSKLSLKASFDDIMRTAKVLAAGIEPEFITFVENQQVCRRRWAQAENEGGGSKTKIIQLESQNKTLEAKYKHARNLIEKEEQKRLKVEQDKEYLERQIALIRELLVDSKGGKLDPLDRERLAFLSNTTYGHRSNIEETVPTKRRSKLRDDSQHSILSDEDIDYWDKTEEDLDTPCGRPRRSKRLQKRPSAPPLEELNETPPKRYKTEEAEVVTTTTITMTADGQPLEAIAEVSIPTDAEVVTTTTITMTADGQPLEAIAEVSIPAEGRKTLNKSFSEPALDKHMAESEIDSDLDPWTPQNKNKNSNVNLKGTPMSPSLRKAHSASKGLNRIHFFISETVIRPRTCVPCGKRIGFGRLAMKCKDCKSMCHPECKDNLPLPCINAPPTPGTGKIQGGVVADYCRDEAPMIPGIVIHCVNEVEARGLQEVGIYRVPGSDRQVKELKEKFFKGKGMPNLSNIDDIHVICGCLKDFLRGLREPLLTFKLWKSFVNAAGHPDKSQGEAEIYHTFNKLPQANKDTMAFLMLHLLRVSQTPECKMTAHNLFRVFGPTLVGHSRVSQTPECKMTAHNLSRVFGPTLVGHSRVSQTPECKMTAHNLSRVFGPTLVGHSRSDPEPMQLINETQSQTLVMEKLFQIPEDYWITFISDDSENLYPAHDANTPKTPEYVMEKLFEIPEDYWITFISDDSENLYPAHDANTPKTPEPARILLESRLGPVHTPNSYDRSKTWTNRTTHTPREEKRKLMPPLKELRRSMSESAV